MGSRGITLPFIMCVRRAACHCTCRGMRESALWCRHLPPTKTAGPAITMTSPICLWSARFAEFCRFKPSTPLHPIVAGLALDCALHAVLALALAELQRRRPQHFSAHRTPLLAACSWNGVRITFRLSELLQGAHGCVALCMPCCSGLGACVGADATAGRQRDGDGYASPSYEHRAAATPSGFTTAATHSAVFDNGWHVHPGSSLAHRLALVTAVSPAPWLAWLLLFHAPSHRSALLILPLLTTLPVYHIPRLCAALLRGSPGLRTWCDDAHRTLWVFQ